MNEDEQQSAGGQGVIISSWPTTPITLSTVPTDKGEFIRYLSCELYKNQSIKDARKQAKEAVNNAIVMYDYLKSKGYLS